MARMSSMPFTRRTQYLLVNAAVLTASAIQLVRHKPLVVVMIAALTFFVAGNVTVFLGGSKQRAIAKQRKIDYHRG